MLRYLDAVIQKGLGTNVRFPNQKVLGKFLFSSKGVFGTRGVGAAAGRAVPYVGAGLILNDTYDIFYNLGYDYGPGTWYGDDDNKWFK